MGVARHVTGAGCDIQKLVALPEVQFPRKARYQLLRERAKESVVGHYRLLPSFVLESFESGDINTRLHIVVPK